MAQGPHRQTTGRTWADLLSGFPVWLLGIAASVFVLLMGYATLFADRPVQLGVLGTWGPESPATPQAIPAGAVVAFDADLKSSAGCPAGWEYFEPGGGRVIVGAGDHDNSWFPAGAAVPERLSIYKTYAQDARAGVQETHEAQATGGEETVVLTPETMPRHDHGGATGRDDARVLINFLGNFSGSQPGHAADTGKSINIGFQNGHAHTLRPAGGLPDGRTAPHNNMPPFIALYFCKKT